MRKKISRTLAFTLLASNINSLAFATDVNIINDVDNNISIIDNNISKTTGSSVGAFNQTVGRLEVDINFVLPIKYTNKSQTDIKVLLKKDGKNIGSVELGSDNLTGAIDNINYNLVAFNSTRGERVTNQNNDVSFYNLTFDNLEKGNYSLEILGNGYQNTVIDNITIDNTSKRVVLGNSENTILVGNKNEKENLENKEIVYPGVFLAGDVNNDSSVNMKDYYKVKEAIKDNDTRYDLNRDGKVNITDLTYVHQNIDKKQQEANIEKTNAILDLDKIKLSNDSAQISNGDLKDLFNRTTEGTVTFQSDGEINETNPMSIGIELGDEPVVMERVNLTVPTINGPEKGNIIVTDENGKEIRVSFDETQRALARSNESVINVDLGQQVAVSKITIQVTGTRGNTNLTEIAKVEFLNNVYEELPKPNLNIPVINYATSKTQTGQEELVLGWDHQANVDLYQIKLEKVDSNGKVLNTQFFKTKDNKITIPKVEAYATYRASIQSLNGSWESGYKNSQEDYDPNKVGATNLDTNKNDMDGKPDNVDKGYIAQAWNSKTGNLSEKANSTVSNSYEGLSGANNYGRDSIIEIQVVPESKPEGPHGISVKGLYKGLEVSWKNHAKAKEFDLYYREKGSKAWFKANDSSYVDSNTENNVPDNIESTDKSKLIKDKTSYTINGLKDNVTYEVIMTATNHHGTGELSEIYTGTTENILKPQIPNYKLINTKSETELTNHIQRVEFDRKEDKYVGDPSSIVDGNYETGWKIKDWDGGVHYGNRMPKVVFDKEYTFDTINFATILENTSLNTLPHEAKIRIYDDSGKEIKVIDRNEITVKHLKGENGQNYVQLKLDDPVTAKNVEVDLAVYAGKNVSISEMKFYHYDSLEDDVNNLFNDDLQLTLKETVNKEQIDKLRERANTVDEASGEYHPQKDDILKDLERAEQLLNDKNLDDELISIDPNISNHWGGNKLGQSNDWQALGVAVRPGDKINIYIGKDGFENTTFQLGISQHYGESSSAIQTYSQELKVGKNEIVIPESIFDMDYEKGGSLYIRFSNRNFAAHENIKVRVSGGNEIPHLNVNNILKTNESEAKKLIREYIKELDTYVTKLPSMYTTDNKYKYDEQTSILNSTEIETDSVMLSLPATQILAGIKDGLTSEDDKVNRVYNTLLAWEQLMDISFLQQGLKEDERAKNRMNIKYQRMFPGAFMYASSHHVGIGFGSTLDMMKGVPFKFDSDGNITNDKEANLFGWGISHEIGHVHDVNGLTYPETTNNILALITQTFDDIDKSRLEGSYDKVYDRVTSHSEATPQGLVGLGMFWQLHLAYDNDNTYEMLKLNADNDLENDTFYAKLYRATREKGIAPQENGFDRVAQTFIMRSSDAVKKDLREFFKRWGITASPKTNEYLNSMNYEKETRDIFYLNDEARRKRLKALNTSDLSMSQGTTVTGTFADGIQDNSYVSKKEVSFNFSVNQDNEKILGYELIRKEIDDKGGFKEVPVGFVERSEKGTTTYTDIVDASNNRVYEYKVKAYDYNLNETETATIGTVKVKHDGSIAKSNFTFDTNTRGAEDTPNANTGHGQVEDGSINNIKDNNKDTVYNGAKAPSHNGQNSKEDAYVTIDLGNNRQVVGLKYTAPTTTTEGYNPIKDYEVLVSKDGKNWIKAHTGIFKDGENTIYFNEKGTSDNNQLWAHNARFVKVISKGQSTISIAELDILGPPGDNIEIGLDQDNNGTYEPEKSVGILSSSYTNGEVTIPEGSLVVMGEFRGNPAYNVPLILNENGENFAMKSQSILLANVPEDAPLGEIAKGTYIYWVTPEQFGEVTLDDGTKVNNLEGTSIKSVLYRYNKLDEDNAPVGQRLVSDSLYFKLPENYLTALPKIHLNSNGNKKLRVLENQEVYKINEKVVQNINN